MYMHRYTSEILEEVKIAFSGEEVCVSLPSSFPVCLLTKN